jgi:dipeptidase PepV
MTLDWQKEIAAYKPEMLADLKALVAIDSSRDLAQKTAAAPLGPGPKTAIEKMIALGQRDGFQTKNIENVAGRIEYGAGPETLGIFSHVDVVPAGDGWETEPFVLTEKDGNLYGRGTSDDKGPLIAAYYGMKLIKKLGLPVHKKIHLIFGSDEENDWYGMTRYQANEPMPDLGFSPDAEFPIINGEKGITNFDLTFAPLDGTGDVQLTHFQSGLASNMVPQVATATLAGTLPADFATQFDTYLADKPVTGQLKDNTLTLTGKVAHSMDPQFGINAATYLADFLQAYVTDPTGHTYLTTIQQLFHLDFNGVKLGIAHHDAIMGDVTASPDIFKFTAGEPALITLNIRYPKGITVADIRAGLTNSLPDNVTMVPQTHAMTPHYVAPDDPLVKTLLAVFEHQTGTPGHEEVVGGGTYGRLLPRGVAFGALFDMEKNVMHQANEYMPTADFFLAAAIYAEAIYRLAQ